VAVAGLVAGGLVFGTPDDRGQAAAGEAPPIELARLNGDGSVSLAALRGRPVVVNFFASWCVPCRKELPAFQSVAERLDGQVAFLGVNHQDDRAGGARMLEELGVTFPAGYDPRGEVALAYGLLGMPSTVFVSPDGRLLERHLGEMTAEQLEAAVERHFGI
jgi:cytochrome c biogenesis protein CcmG/thiol:disulfide interchange protein DsbE